MAIGREQHTVTNGGISGGAATYALVASQDVAESGSGFDGESGGHRSDVARR
jgi:hypothetical protein